MKPLNTTIALLAAILAPLPAIAWNIPGHMLSGAIAYKILQRENPAAIPVVRSILEKNSWYESRWKSQLEKLPEGERDEMLFMLAAVGPMIFARETKPRAVCRGITWTSRSNPKASQQASRPWSHPKRISSQP
jgi:hypothetical protein